MKTQASVSPNVAVDWQAISEVDRIEIEVFAEVPPYSDLEREPEVVVWSDAERVSL